MCCREQHLGAGSFTTSSMSARQIERAIGARLRRRHRVAATCVVGESLRGKMERAR
jgi:hypothetical protein